LPAPATGSDRLENVGRVRNRGLELSFDASLLNGPDRHWSAGLVFAAERNEVVDLGEFASIATGGVSGQGQSGNTSQRIMPGHPLGTFWGPEFLRVNGAGQQVFRCVDPQRADCVNGETTNPLGDDFTVIGNANPDFTLGLRSNGGWGNLDFSFLIRASVGNDVFNNTALVHASKSTVLQNRNFLASALDDGVAMGEPAIFSSKWIEDGSFVRLQNITIGYRLDQVPGLQARNARLYLSGDNLLLLTGYSGYDPEVHTEAGLASRGIDYLSYPRARTFTAGVRVSF
jgi:TonB-dependent starch-binding outer membrane protein SusC